MVRTYRARKDKSRQKTYRRALHGGSIKSVEDKLRSTPIDGIKLINPTSKFIVATYWWGKENMNKNLQNPCPEEIMDLVKIEVVSKFGRRYNFPKHLVTARRAFRETQATRDMTLEEVDIAKRLEKQWDAWVTSLMADRKQNAELDKFIVEKTKEITDRELGKTGKVPRGFPDMIREWEEYCTKAGVNHVAINAEFPRSDYQNAINGKPLFIQQVLDAVKGKGPNGTDLGVLYIDGDMWMLKYPDIFDIDNVDFMARGWNMDSRSKEQSLKKPAYDPYIFETSGGTMYFGNTQAARALLDEWNAASSKPEQAGKADDRILSQIFTKDTMILGTNIINLPIEYLWLTDNYKSYLTEDASSPASLKDAYIEHPYCLTGEERATDQGAALSRQPEGYDEEITEMINYKRPPELFYEYIFFDGDMKKRDGFSRYLAYMKTALNHWTKEPLITLIDFGARYGEFTAIADENLKGLVAPPTPVTEETLLGSETPAPPKTDPFAPEGERLTFGSPQPVRKGGADPALPLDTPIPEILKRLMAGTDVYLGETLEHDPEIECMATDASTKGDGINEYTRKLRIDTKKPMFFSAKSKVLVHLLAMCKTLEDINTHINGSYMFMSRIRWKIVKSGVIPAIKSGIDFKRVVHQIWFGEEMPAWRKKLFETNESVCNAHGFQYKLWKNVDRTEENYEQTIKYQNDAMKIGTASGQSRWAQVADLARLELIYNGSGIYVDSIIEISPALLLGVVNAINGGATFVGCNEDPCDPPLDCENAQGEKYLTNSFFAATRANPIFKRLLERLDTIDLEDTRINHTTGPYFLRSGITPEDKIFLFDSAQIFPFNAQPTPYKPEPKPDRFLVSTRLPGVFQYKDKPPMYYVPGGIKVLQAEFLVEKGLPDTLPEFEQMEKLVELKGPLAIYHSGLGGTWSL